MPAGLGGAGGGATATGAGADTFDCTVIVFVAGASLWILISGGGTKGGGGFCNSGGGGGGGFTSAFGGMTAATISFGIFAMRFAARPVASAQITTKCSAITNATPTKRRGVAFAVWKGLKS